MDPIFRRSNLRQSLLAILFFLTPHILAQETKGRVMDLDTRAPISQALITIPGMGTTTSNASGYFALFPMTTGIGNQDPSLSWNPTTQEMALSVTSPIQIHLTVTDVGGKSLTKPVTVLATAGTWRWSPLAGVEY